MIAKDRDLAGIVVSEIKELERSICENRPHPKEDRLSGKLSKVRYLRIYKRGFSVRIYFTFHNKVLWMLALNPAKARTRLTSGDEETLLHRYEWVVAQGEHNEH